MLDQSCAINSQHWQNVNEKSNKDGVVTVVMIHGLSQRRKMTHMQDL